MSGVRSFDIPPLFRPGPDSPKQFDDTSGGSRASPRHGLSPRLRLRDHGGFPGGDVVHHSLNRRPGQLSGAFRADERLDVPLDPANVDAFFGL